MVFSGTPPNTCALGARYRNVSGNIVSAHCRHMGMEGMSRTLLSSNRENVMSNLIQLRTTQCSSLYTPIQKEILSAQTKVATGFWLAENISHVEEEHTGGKPFSETDAMDRIFSDMPGSITVRKPLNGRGPSSSTKVGEGNEGKGIGRTL
ncbi:hypothetical protein B0J17DRAFT_631927 [Rhizoctonia solani]|nr:hypothetical protein B0J17DRAFT_631927 [Rhizoctonia solani]